MKLKYLQKHTLYSIKYAKNVIQDNDIFAIIKALGSQQEYERLLLVILFSALITHIILEIEPIRFKTLKTVEALYNDSKKKYFCNKNHIIDIIRNTVL